MLASFISFGSEFQSLTPAYETQLSWFLEFDLLTTKLRELMDDLIDESLCLVNLACISEGSSVLYALYIVTAICNLIRFGAVSIRLAFIIGLTLDCEQLKMIDKTFN